MKILAIETSCDETAIAIVEANHATNNRNGFSFSILGNKIASQIAMHQPYGGVFPALAKREHQKAISPLLDEVLLQAGIEKNNLQKEIDLIAVTHGPGLEPALWVGVQFAKELAEKYSIPVIGVNHMEGHVLSSLAPKDVNSFETLSITFPALSLLVSGGHTELVIVKNFGEYEKIGQTVDDAAGEAFDKVARMLGLQYPGGPEISKLAAQYGDLKDEEKLNIQFPKPMLHSGNYDFSFSGLKTAVLYYIRDHAKNLSEIEKINIAHAFQTAAVEVLVKKTMRAAEEYGVHDILVGGGVAQNNYLQEELAASAEAASAPEAKKLNIYFPRTDFAGDNALMIAFAGFVEWEKHKNGNEKSPDQNGGALKANGTLSL